MENADHWNYVCFLNTTQISWYIQRKAAKLPFCCYSKCNWYSSVVILIFKFLYFLLVALRAELVTSAWNLGSLIKSWNNLYPINNLLYFLFSFKPFSINWSSSFTEKLFILPSLVTIDELNSTSQFTLNII